MCEFSVYYQFFKDCDENGSVTWYILNDKFLVLYYYNDNDIGLKKILNRFNFIANKFEISKKGWKLPFCMEHSNAEKWNYDFKKRLNLL